MRRLPKRARRVCTTCSTARVSESQPRRANSSLEHGRDLAFVFGVRRELPLELPARMLTPRKQLQRPHPQRRLVPVLRAPRHGTAN
jgi:hypothetical protein